MMQLYGYYSEEQSQPVALREVTIAGSPEQMRELAKFFAAAAEEFEAKNGTGVHLHLQDFMRQHGGPDVIAYKKGS